LVKQFKLSKFKNVTARRQTDRPRYEEMCKANEVACECALTKTQHDRVYDLQISRNQFVLQKNNPNDWLLRHHIIIIYSSNLQVAYNKIATNIIHTHTKSSCR